MAQKKIRAMIFISKEVHEQLKRMRETNGIVISKFIELAIKEKIDKITQI